MKKTVRRVVVAMAAWAFVSTAGAQEAAPPSPLGVPPAGDDYTHTSLRAYQQQLLAAHGHYRDIPLDAKAEYFSWELWRYHKSPFHTVFAQVLLPDAAGPRPQGFPDRDGSTWNGSYLSALSYEYAVKRDAQTLGRIVEFLQGLHFFFEVTGMPGLPARCVNRADGIVYPPMQGNRYTAGDGTQYYYEADPAKGGFNQIAGGYATLFMLAYDDLPPQAQHMARADAAALVLHLIDHNYRATHRDGRPTTYGDLTPLVGSVSVPFNAQVAYEIVALGYSFPPDDPAARERIRQAFEFLRGKHHVYYEDPWKLVQPQKIGYSNLVKGTNDRNHVANAAFVGLALELDHARRSGNEPNAKFLHQLGQTLLWTTRHPTMARNALCNFMWAGLAQDPRVFDAVVEHKPNSTRAEIEDGLAAGIEQLRRFRLDRFYYPGREYVTPGLNWCDTFRPDDTYWKTDPHDVWEPTQPATNQIMCAMDYLYAYWLFRYYRLDELPYVKKLNLPALRSTPGLRPLDVD